MTRHARPWKEAQLAELKAFLDGSEVIGLASLTGFPAGLFQELRKKLKGKARIKVSKLRVIKKALEESKFKEYQLQDLAEGSIALIATSMNPFELYGFIKKNKGSIPAKAGQEAPSDILITARDTGLPPGPALSDLKAAGLSVRMQGASIHIMADKVVARKGELISKPVADTLSKLNVKPIKVGLSIIAVLEAGEVFKASVLDIDEERVLASVQDAFRNALNLAVFAAYPNLESTSLLVQKSFKNVKAVALEANLLVSATVDALLAKANAQALALQSKIPETPPEENKEEEAGESEGEDKVETKAESGGEEGA